MHKFCIRSGGNDASMKRYMSVESLKPAAGLAVDDDGEKASVFSVEHV